MAKMCTMLARGNRKECLRPVPEGVDSSLCLVHLIMAHQDVVKLGGVKAVAGMVRTAS